MKLTTFFSKLLLIAILVALTTNISGQQKVYIYEDWTSNNDGFVEKFVPANLSSWVHAQARIDHYALRRGSTAGLNQAQNGNTPAWQGMKAFIPTTDWVAGMNTGLMNKSWEYADRNKWRSRFSGDLGIIRDCKELGFTKIIMYMQSALSKGKKYTFDPNDIRPEQPNGGADLEQRVLDCVEYAQYILANKPSGIEVSFALICAFPTKNTFGDRAVYRAAYLDLVQQFESRNLPFEGFIFDAKTSWVKNQTNTLMNDAEYCAKNINDIVGTNVFAGWYSWAATSFDAVRADNDIISAMNNIKNHAKTQYLTHIWMAGNKESGTHYPDYINGVPRSRLERLNQLYCILEDLPDNPTQAGDPILFPGKNIQDITDLAATVQNCSTVVLNWTDNSSGEGGFRVRRKVVGEPTFSNLADVNANIETYTDNSVLEGTNYIYMVRPLDGTVAVATSNTPQANVIACPQPNIPPVASAGPNQTVNDADDSGNELITLNGSGSEDTDGTIESYVWTEGGVQIATGVSPTVELGVGTHAITLTVTDDDGAPDSDNVTITVTEYVNLAPTANAGPDQTVTDTDNSGAETVTLDGSGSSDADGTISGYVWTEGGSQIATGVNPSVSLSVGTHTISLTVTDDDGATGSDNVTITVNEGGPVKDIKNINDLTATATNCTTVVLNWTDNSTGEGGFRIRRKLPSDAVYTNLTDVPANSETYTDNTAAENTTYIYMVRPLDGTTAVATSNTPQVSTLTCTTACTTPGNTTFSVSDASSCSQSNGSITFSFTDDPVRTNISFSIDGGTNYTKVGDNTGSYTFSGLAAGTYPCMVQWGNGDCPTDLGDIVVDCQTSSVTITFGAVKTDCNASGKARNVIPFTVSGSTATPSINKGDLLTLGGGEYKIRHIGMAFGSTQNYTVTVEGVSESITVQTVSSCPKSTEGLTASLNIEIYPNPVSSELNILLNKNIESRISVHTLSGQIMHANKYSESLISIDVEKFNPGIYILRIETADNILQEQIIVQ